MKKISYSAYLLLLLISLFSSVSNVCATGVIGGRLYLSPESGVHRLGETFVVRVLADTDNQKVNALEAELSYNPSYFSVESLSTDDSILTSWSTAPSYDGASGVIKFSGWVGKQYVGTDGLLVAITLRPLRVGQSIVSFNSGAMLASDSQGSNIITTMSSGNFAISPAQAVAPALPTTTPTSLDNTTNTAPVDTAVPNQPTLLETGGVEQSASVISSGVELAPAFLLFFMALALIAFCIAYVLHRKGVR